MVNSVFHIEATDVPSPQEGKVRLISSIPPQPELSSAFFASCRAAASRPPPGPRCLWRPLRSRYRNVLLLARSWGAAPTTPARAPYRNRPPPSYAPQTVRARCSGPLGRTSCRVRKGVPRDGVPESADRRRTFAPSADAPGSALGTLPTPSAPARD